MNIKELIEHTYTGKIKLLATATNGLNPNSDKLLAVKLLTVWPDEVADTLMITRDSETVNKNSEYHKMSPELINTYGEPVSVVKKKFEEAIKDSIILTYNCGFQIRFLEQICEFTETLKLYDLTCIEKATRNCHVYTDSDCENIQTFFEACAMKFDPVAMTKYCKEAVIAPGETRLDYMASVSQKVFYEVLSREFQVLAN